MHSKLSAPSVAGLILASFATACVFLLCAAVGARASDEHVLDPVLSLSGGAGVTSLDPVPDPGSAHPTRNFNNPCGVTTDEYGDVYVASPAQGPTGVGPDGTIDVFGPDGEFITEVPNEQWPCSLAVDSSGRLYVYENHGNHVVRYDPLVYSPASGEIEYGAEPDLIAGAIPGGSPWNGMAFDPSDGRVYIEHEKNTVERNVFEELLADGTLGSAFHLNGVELGASMAIWGQSHDFYLPGNPIGELSKPRVYVMDATSHEVKLTLDGSNTPDGEFGFSSGGRTGIAVDQSNGDIYVDDVKIHHAVDQFDSDGDFIGQLKLPGNGLKISFEFNDVAVDQGQHSPNQGYVYVTSGESPSNSHLYAFAPRDVHPPEVRDAHVAEAGESEALLAGEVNPHGAATAYHFEYGLADCSVNPCQSVPAPAGQAGADATFRRVSTPLVGLAPGTTYHFRLVASNHCTSVEPAEECAAEGPDRTFSTFAARAAESCPNAALRTGPSAGLSDCRAYELVSPPDTNGRVPTGVVFGSLSMTAAPVLLASADGESVVFGAEGGALPGLEGGGYVDSFESRRGPSGWSTEFSGLAGAESQGPLAGGVSTDHAYSLWNAFDGKGSLGRGEFLRGPGGSIEAVGIGSLGSADAHGDWVSAGGSHLIFESKVQLEPNAPPSGTNAVYDRSPGGPTHVVSLLPGEATPAAGQNSSYLGAAAQGNAVALGIGNAIYERIDSAETVKVTDGPAIFGGISADGSRVFYVKGGNAFAFDSATQTTTQVGSGGESTMVNVSADGSHVYFVSPVVLTGTEANDRGATALAGEENLYVWDAATEAVRFVAVVTEEDVLGEVHEGQGVNDKLVGGLGLWTSDAVRPDQGRAIGLANDPSRTSADGSVFVFESRARLSDYDNEGRSEIYRYDAVAGGLDCISCNPTGVPPVSDARLESRYGQFPFSIPPVNALSEIANLSAGGRAVLFQTADRLAPSDLDGKIDVYEWQADGFRSCNQPAGCIRLISGGKSTADDYLYGASDDGASVFFLSGDSLVSEDPDRTPSLYVARVDGGFPPPSAPPGDCLGEACQPAVVAPDQATPASSIFAGPGNPRPAATRRCPKGKRKVSGKRATTHCAGRHAKHKRAHSHRRASR